MKTILLFLIFSLLSLAQRPQAPAKDQIDLSNDEKQERLALDLQLKIIDQQFDLLRLKVCWARKLSPEECGKWINNISIQKVSPVKKSQEDKETQELKDQGLINK